MSNNYRNDQFVAKKIKDKPLVGLSLMPQANYHEAIKPLITNNSIEAISLTIDLLHTNSKVPDWFLEAISIYSNCGGLFGHLVNYDGFNAEAQPHYPVIFDAIDKDSVKYNFNHITYHYGMMGAGKIKFNAPLSVPYNDLTKKLALARMYALQHVASCPIGIENLAFAYSAQDVFTQAMFIRELLQASDGVLLLDCHNLYCQAKNFSIPFEKILDCYPLNRIRELHIAGGTWDTIVDNNKNYKLRQDTHDDFILDETFVIAEYLLKHCPNIKAVIYERMPSAFSTNQDYKDFWRDYEKLSALVASTDCAASSNRLKDHNRQILNNNQHTEVDTGYCLIADPVYADFQKIWLELIYSDLTFHEVKQKIIDCYPAMHVFLPFIEQIEPHMFYFARHITNKWSIAA